MTNKTYNKYVEQKSPKTNLWQNMLLAFISGGLICIAAQGIFDLMLYLDMTEQQAKNWLPIIMILIAAILTCFNIYDKFAIHAGAGALVPITGFSNAITSSAMEFKSEGAVVGVGAKMFAVVGPVILFGTLASVIAGIYYFFAL